MRVAAGLILLLGVAAAAPAAVYKWVDERGITHYSDEAGPGRKKVQVAPIQTYESPGIPQPAPAKAPAKPSPPFAGYEELVVTTPANDATLRSNAGDVAVGIRLKPDLRKSDAIKIFLDGRALRGGGRSTVFTLPNIGRGTHILQAVIVDSAGRELSRSKIVTFHLQRVSIRNKRPG